MKKIAVILVCLFMVGCYVRKKSDGTYEAYSESIYKVEITGECEGISVSKYETDSESGSGYDSQLYSVLNTRKKKVTLPYVEVIKIVKRDRVVLGVYSKINSPKVFVKVIKDGKTFYVNQWNTNLTPIYLNLDD